MFETFLILIHFQGRSFRTFAKLLENEFLSIKRNSDYAAISCEPLALSGK
jgi:hypothetical protein